MTEVAEVVTPEPAAAVESPAPAPEPAAQTPADGFASLPEKTQQEVRSLRSEASTLRERARTAEQKSQTTMDAIAKALGLKGDDDPAAAAKTAGEERDAARLDAKTTKIENAVLRAAGKNGANPEALTDSRSFMRAREALDPTADDFAAQIDVAIKAAVKANPALLATAPTPARSGGPVNGGAPAGKHSDDPQQRSRDYYERQASK